MDFIRGLIKGDKYIWGIYFFLCIVSVIEMYSASSTLAYRVHDHFAPVVKHIVFLSVGTMAVLAIHNLPYSYFRKIIPWILLPIAAALLIFTMAFGESVNDAQRWITFLGIPFQPSEIAKFAVICQVAATLSNKREDPLAEKKDFNKLLILIGVFCGLILPENFSTAALLGIVCFCMIFIGRMQTKKLFLIAIGLASFFGLVIYSSPYLPKELPALDRLDTWHSRFSEFSQGKESVPLYNQKAEGKNYQTMHAHMAIANGGMLGKFPGNSQLRDFLPQAYSDFIYAIIFEELGFWGALAIMLAYLSLLIRVGVIAKRCTKAFPAYLIMGLSMLIVFQALVNMSVAVSLIPVTGQPLPLISRGGTSTLVTCVYFGVILSISRFSEKEEQEDEEEETSVNNEKAENAVAGNPLENLI